MFGERMPYKYMHIRREKKQILKIRDVTKIKLRVECKKIEIYNFKI